MVKDHSDSEKGNLLPPHRLLLSINIGFFYMHHPTDRIAHTTAFVTPVVEHWLEREIAQWVHPMKDRSDDPLHHERMLYLWATSRSQHFIKLNPLINITQEYNILQVCTSWDFQVCARIKTIPILCCWVSLPCGLCLFFHNLGLMVCHSFSQKYNWDWRIQYQLPWYHQPHYFP